MWTTWALVRPLAPTHVAAGDLDGNGRADLVIDFGAGIGIWTFRNGTTWAPVHPTTSEGFVLLDRDGNGRDDVVIDFGPGIGVWAHVNSAEWEFLHDLSPETMAAGQRGCIVNGPRRSAPCCCAGPRIVSSDRGSTTCDASRIGRDRPIGSEIGTPLLPKNLGPGAHS